MKHHECSQERVVKKEVCVNSELPPDFVQYLSSVDCNIQAVCRICLSTSNTKLFPLYFTNENYLLSTMFTSFTSINVCESDDLPSQVCESCKTQVTDCYEFKVKCIKTDSILKSLLKGEFNIKVEPAGRKGVIAGCQVTDIKEELVTDVQYLEDFSDFASDDNDGTFNIAPRTSKRKRKTTYKASIEQESKRRTKTNIIVPKSEKKSKSNACSICSKTFVNLKALKAHVIRMHDSSGSSELPNSCSQCRESFSSEHDLKLHSALHSKGPVWQCNECHKQFQTRTMLRRHIHRHMDHKPYACDACGKSFAEFYALLRHTRVHTGEPCERRHACHLCDKRYSASGLLAAHLASHNDVRPFVCASCGKAFGSERLLRSHRRVHSDEKRHECRYCGKRFRHESTRNTHHRTHTGEKPYICTVCGKAFIQNSNLTLHMRTHTGEKPYTCETCGRRFSSGSTLKSHVRSHTGDKPYSCDQCGKKFARKDMQGHKRLHSGERPYACGMCARSFTRAARLREHSRVHTGEKPYECETCTLKYPTKAHLVKHVKSHQKKKPKQGGLLVRNVDQGQPYILTDKFIITQTKENDVNYDESDKEMIITTEEVPLVSEELVLEDCEMKSDLLVVDDTQSSNYESETLCLAANGVNFVNDLNYANDVNLVTVNEEEVSISSSSAVVEGTTVKLYQLDQSLVQIHHCVGRKVTISKITSKMTANF